MRKIYSFANYRLGMLKHKINAWQQAANLRAYESGSREPWSRGYNEYKWSIIEKTLSDLELMKNFSHNCNLPPGYGVALDERVVEYPWVLSRIPSIDNLSVLDAGSVFNFEQIIKHPNLSGKHLTIVNLNPEKNCFWKKGISYLFADIRDLPFKDNSFDIITCISTLEHIGMDNKIYTGKNDVSAVGDFAPALIELWRVLKNDGRLLITVPFGKYRDFGFFQQFDFAHIKKISKILSPKTQNIDYFKYYSNGWQKADAAECRDAEYFDVRSGQIAPDAAAAARAVACLQLIK